MADSHSSGDYSDVVSRRKFVSLAGTTGAAAVAGCIGGDGGGDDDNESDSDGGGDTDGDSDNTDDTDNTDDSDDTDDTDDDPEPEPGGNDYPDQDVTFQTYGTAAPPSSFRFNVTAGWPIPHAQFGMYEDWAKYYNVLDEWRPHLISEWEHGDGEMVLTMSEDYTWSNGNSVTASDLVMQLNLQEEVGDVAWDIIDGVEETGDYELTVSYDSSTNTDLVDYAILQKSAAFPPEIFEDADWSALTDLTIDDPVSSGPIVVENVSDSLLETSVRDDHQRSDHYNWNGYDLGYKQNNQAGQQSFIAQEMDGVHSQFVPPDQLENFSDSIREFRIPGNFGMGVWPVHDKEPWGDRNVRQAVYYSLDREAIIEDVGTSTKVSHHPYPTGLTWATVEQYLGTTEPEGFNFYARNLEEAEARLEEAGTSMSDIGQVSVTYPSGWSDWSIAADNLIEQLDTAGWNVNSDPRGTGPGTYASGGLLSDNEDMDLVVDQHTAGGAPEMNVPYFSLRYLFNNTTRYTEEHFAGYDSTESVEISSGEVVPDDLLGELATATDDERDELIMQLAEVVNKDVPVIYIMEKYEQSFIDTRRFDIPEQSEEFNVFWPLWWLPMVDQKLESASEEATEGLMKASADN